MYLLDGTLVTSASDLTVASQCEFALLRSLDVKAGRLEDPGFPEDGIMMRAASLGDAHERRILDSYREQFGSGVVEIPKIDSRNKDQIADAVALTRQAFRDGADVVFQATFFEDDGTVGFIGFADFITKQPGGHYRVEDSKLARHAKVPALLQLAAYAEKLVATGIAVDPEVELILGDSTRSTHHLSDIAPVYRLRRDRLLSIASERQAEGGVATWGDPRYGICGHCDWCTAELERTRDPLLVANLRLTQRAKLHGVGIVTIDQLAASDGPVDGIGRETIVALREQARLQVAATPDTPPPVDVFAPEALGVIPAPSEGDIFFDFEGDPLYTEAGGTRWGLDYLFGWVDAAGDFTAIWAHNFAEERQALRTFLDFVNGRRRRYPDMHIYHYACYERTHLLSLAARHGIGEDEVDDLLRQHVLVDLYPAVRKSMRIGSPSYSIKKLEPLYMGDDEREGVANAADSVVEYAAAGDLLEAGDEDGWRAKLADIERYNAYDCLSTLKLRNWLRARATEHGVVPLTPADVAETPAEGDALGDGQEEHPRSVLARQLLGHAGDPIDPNRTADERAVAMAAAALEYFRREGKIWWHDHFARLVDPKEDWVDSRDVFDVHEVELIKDWHLPTAKSRLQRRTLRLTGVPAPGSKFPVGKEGPHLLYDYPGPAPDPRNDPGARSAIKVLIDQSEPNEVIVSEPLRADPSDYKTHPIAVSPGMPPRTKEMQEATDAWASRLADTLPAWPADAMVDVFRRIPPRLKSGHNTLPVVEGDDVASVTAGVLALDNSYLAVQGPPGTGKTHVGSHVIAQLVRENNWKIGVVGQSHAVVENLLNAVVTKAGLDPALVGKGLKGREPDHSTAFTLVEREDRAEFVSAHHAAGYVVGGTTWDFVGDKGFNGLDLLVIDEAGQFSLVHTLAASLAARNLLLLGDPQQLPQVTQGTHPEPVDTSALGWISEGHDVLPAELGYFLAQTYRMHPSVALPVSHLSYEGRLEAHPSTALRHLEGLAPGLTSIPVEHDGNSTASAEEAESVVALIRDLIGTLWTDPGKRDASPLTERDFIVVTPYNAQIVEVKRALEEAGLSEVPVGTVDRFQGQEAVISIVTLAASSAADVPRGMEFLIMRNRLNVAISRAQWASHLIYSPGLLAHLPGKPEGLAELSAFARLADGSRTFPMS
jgi:uncharacterized protein